MLDVNQRYSQSRKPSLSRWVYQAITEAAGSSVKIRLRIRLRGNDLHILCEGSQKIKAIAVVRELVKAMKSQEGSIRLLSKDYEEPIYRVILYGRKFGQGDIDWIKPIVLGEIEAQISNSSESKQQKNTGSGENKKETSLNSGLLVSNQSLARSGSPEAIARYLSDCFSYLGVSIRVISQKLSHPSTTKTEPLPTDSEESQESQEADKILWVICNCNYSPEASLLAEPIAQKLRNLELEGFREAIIRFQVSGESTLDWIFRVDLTPPQIMLQQWANWGDVEAIARLLNRALAAHHLEVRTVLKDQTIHLFCRVLPSHPDEIPEQQTTVGLIAPILQSLAPQGIEAATIFGTIDQTVTKQSPQTDDTPVWIHWLNLPGATASELESSPFSLAKQGNQDALNFLLQRALNPDLDWRLATGGIRFKIRQKQDLLHIISEAVVCPTQAQVVEPIEQLFRQLELPNLTGVRIYGRGSGQNSPLWHHGIDFVKRKYHSSATVADFIATELYRDESFTPTTEPDSRPQEVERATFKDIFKTALEGISQVIKSGLCASQLFVPSIENLSQQSRLYSTASQQNFSAYRGLKVALVWSVLGLLLTIQTDWLIGRLVFLKIGAKSSPPVKIDSSVAQAQPKAVSLPKLSLQKSAFDSSDDFNSSLFTKQGDTNLVFNENDLDNSANRSITAILAAARSSNPSFNNRLLDEKLALYQQRISENGPPDVMIIGSSRAMRGVDPQALQNALLAQGYPKLEIFNFGINGATVQVVDLVLRRILTPQQLPKLIIFADGARAFNSGRDDITYQAIANSPAYQQLAQGTFPRTNAINPSNKSSIFSEDSSTISTTNTLLDSHKIVDEWLNQSLAKISSTYPQREQFKTLVREHFTNWFSLTTQQSRENVTQTEKLTLTEQLIDFNGFLPLSVLFDPDTYYEKHPKVSGLYDSDYSSFNLKGKQHTALVELLNFLSGHQIELVVVNQPLTDQYLDSTRQKYEQKFQQYMGDLNLKNGLIFRDLAGWEQWQNKYQLFSDPSHLNRHGAYQVSLQLAKDPMINWPTFKNE